MRSWRRGWEEGEEGEGGGEEGPEERGEKREGDEKRTILRARSARRSETGGGRQGAGGGEAFPLSTPL